MNSPTMEYEVRKSRCARSVSVSRSQVLNLVIQLVLLLSVLRQTVALSNESDALSPSESKSNSNSTHPLPTTRSYKFKIKYANRTVLCNTSQIVTVNGKFPGPTIKIYEGDRILVKLVNRIKYNISIHWHGVDQRLSAWADGIAGITQCPIQPGQSYTYNFTVPGQEGTLWWHAHTSWLRATAHGFFIIYPKPGNNYPFAADYPPIHKEVPILLGDYWPGDVEQYENQLIASGGGPNSPGAYLIDGQPGTNYSTALCADPGGTYTLGVRHGKTYLLRLANVAVNTELFFSIANHSLTVVEADGWYTKPYTSSYVFISPGQTASVLLTANQSTNASYTIVLSPYDANNFVTVQTIPAIGLLEYKSAKGNLTSNSSSPNFYPDVPGVFDSNSTTKFIENLKGLSNSSVPQTVDRRFFLVIALNLIPCANGSICTGFEAERFEASINNVSFITPKSTSILQAYYYNISGIYTTDFPGDGPATPYNYTGEGFLDHVAVSFGTKASVIEYGSNVEIVLQDSNNIGAETHPIHLHGFSFFVVGRGFGNYDNATAKLNLVDPVKRNTVELPSGGWAVIRFTADNPGVWFMHCHFDMHLTWGMKTVFIVKNGIGPNQTLPAPPADYLTC